MDRSKHTSFNIVMIGSEEGWVVKGRGTRGIFFARAFARSPRVDKVLMINCPRSFLGALNDKSEGWNRADSICPVILRHKMGSVVSLGPKLYMLNTTTMLPESSGGFASAERRWLAVEILQMIEKMGFKKGVLWVLNPRMVDIAKEIASDIVVFDAIDDLLLHPQARRHFAKIKDGYRWIEENASLICHPSKKQVSMFSAKEKLFLLPNGVEDIFLEEGMALPSDISKIGRPRVVYAGALQERFDIGLMAGVVKMMPDHNFIFVGEEFKGNDFGPLKKFSNVRFLGHKSYSSIPAYLAGADVCIIPHKVNKFTDSQDPLKVYEYMAAGKPIVSTRVAGTEDLEGIYLADDAVTFAGAIKRAMAENSPSRGKERRAAALMHSWDSRADMVLSKIVELLSK